MNPVLRESLAKGLFLGLWSYLALVRPDLDTFLRVLAWGVGGFALALVAGTAQQLVRGFRPGRNPAGFALLVLLDSPYFIALGLVGGFALGVVLEVNAKLPAEAIGDITGPPGREWLAYCAAGGLVLGYGLFQLRSIPSFVYRVSIGLGLGAALTYLAIHYVQGWPEFANPAAQRDAALLLLCGVPFFYLMTFCGEAEESEIEIGAICAALAIGLYLLRLDFKLSEQFDKAIFLVPLGLYFVYATRWLPGLRVFKHNLRGYGYLSLGRFREATLSFTRALQLDRRNQLAADGLAKVLRRIDFATLDEKTARLLPTEFCLTLAGQLLLGRVPNEAERADALKLLDVAARQNPALLPRADYLVAIAATHGRDFDRAAGRLSRLLDPEAEYDGPRPNPLRQAQLFDAWNLALRLHPEIVERLGQRELARPGRRVEAIAAVERHLAASPEDPVGVELKRELYSGLSESEFLAAAQSGIPSGLNYDYLEQLGQSLIGDPDPAQVERGMAYLRIAARGEPGRAVALFHQLAGHAATLGRGEEADGYRGQVKRAGLALGSAKLAGADRGVYLSTLLTLSDAAAAKGDYGNAVDDYRLYVESGNEDAATLRKLAELHAAGGDALNALLVTERGLLYAKADPALLALKDSYYYSVTEERVAAVKQQVRSWFDVAYCVRKARQVTDQREADLDTLDYGLHLARLARAIEPESQAAMLAQARLLIRKGERDAGLALLEDIRQMPRGGGDDEDAWFQATKRLGDMYLDELGRPDLAVQCFSDYREYQRSGADTLFRLGEAHEAKGNIPAAIQAYEAVTAYQGHPRFYDARQAADRLKA